MKVYVIEKGLYSDRYIIGVTDSEETAKIIQKQYDRNNDTCYTEYDTDSFKVVKPMGYTIFYDTRTGAWYGYPDEYGVHNYTQSKYLGKEANRSNYTTENYAVLANSLDQAIKIAQDMQMMRLAEENNLL